MNRLMVLVMFAAAFAFAACGGGANNAGGGNAGNAGGNEAGHSHEDGGHHHEGEQHDLGHRTKDDWHYGATQIGDPEAGGELVFEVHLQKGGKDVSDATVAVWIGDKDGKELAPRGTGSWSADEGVYDCHTQLPKELKEGMKFWVAVKQGGSEVIKDSFDVVME